MDKARQQEVTHWLKMNLKAEKRILGRLKEAGDKKRVKVKEEQIKYLESRLYAITLN